MPARKRSKREAALAEERRVRAAHQIDLEMQDQAAASDREFEHAIEEWKDQREPEATAEASPRDKGELEKRPRNR